jgi:type II secretion system protein J
MPNPRRGFTFLELLIAVTIFSIVAVAIYSSFNVGIRAWGKTEGSYKIRQEARHSLDTMGRELRCAVKLTLKDPAGAEIDSFEGSSAKISFWRPTKEGVSKVTYLFDKEARALYYISQPYKEALAGAEGVKSLLASGVSDLKVKYAYLDGDDVVWQDGWKDKDHGIPMGVKAALSYDTDNGQTVEFDDTVFVPTGVIKDVSEQTE